MKALLIKLSIGLLLLLMFLPVALWYLKEPTELQVTILDKTVPDETYREHLGITWVLNSYKYEKKDGSSYHAATDYYGFVPNESEQTYSVQPLPESLDDADVIYVADTYGVYEEDLPWIDLEREGTRSELLYGGLEMEEWQTIYDRLQQEKRSTLIVEFNSFASPTEENVRDSVSEYLYVKRSGWIGRYFQELDHELNDEIPAWMLDHYNELGLEWNYEGPGFILVDEEAQEIVVLLEKEHFNEKGIRMSFTERGQELFNLTTSPNYLYWFDVVEAEREEDVLAYYDWDLTDEGKAELLKHDLPIQFAAVVGHDRPQSRSFYFAGDFTDIAEVPKVHQYKGINKLKALLAWDDFSEERFFWKTYVPMMKTILELHTAETLIEPEEAVAVAQKDGLAYTARIKDQDYEVFVDDEWKKLQIHGVNLGMGKPGTFPGEAAIKEKDYYRWFEQIGEMGGNAIRVYTLHPPGFYHALKRYNEQHENPIYLFHGVWIDEEPLEDTLDAFDEETNEEFQQEMKRIVDVIHGNAVVDPNPGHAHGVYQADVSPYTIGWIIGIEWYPHTVKATNKNNPDIGDYDGKYVETKDAEPFEYWLANQFDILLSYEIEQYNWIRPVSFTNWVTTDLLTHPAEPNEDEDLVGVDPNVIHLKGPATETNQFASYHVYPYYPDFLNYEEDYIHYVDHRGELNNYAGYLKDLHDAHDLPILIAEFGVPASRGLTHENPFGKNQGFLSEEEQGKIVVELFEDIIEEKLLGGLIFTWQDEWFKRTWNTMDYDNPDRRPFWSNAQTNEQQFGLLSFDRLKVKVNGDDQDWEDASLLYEEDHPYVKRLYMDHDERYLYFRIDMKSGSTDDFFKDGFPILVLDTLPGQGNEHIKEVEGVTFDHGIDFIIELKGYDESRVKVDAYYDFFTYQYSQIYQMIEETSIEPQNNTGVFQKIHYALNQEIRIPSTNEVIPFSYYETGELRHGNGDPEADDYDSLADFFVNEEKGMIEVRIPWLLLSFKDPSQREVMSAIYEGEGGETSEIIEGVRAAVLFVEPKDDDSYQVVDALPALDGDRLTDEVMNMYTWETWDIPLYEERLKQSYDLVKEAFTSIKE
ncbi:hypothetical protein P4637_09995 [Halalkalibacterium halodurans]|uniref:BH2230 protein n=1 Tax=Halalkalibacterium halodurans (strain ATCC BAA-125 / DSM 18197 / FERM 7344 / JCM 9153 / C-125) TaxID=272558 RepID=Q9KAQ7_HALH5|nr:hypothetical protein [Halalkalibacterium halodurans]MED4080985.1 hypothetical protein [Halalkalibacterium halodurans]MED4085168.1 hypothetical protein [Halalkalibacterium halodurans]MED4105254.1 hypothetical protein [Halalkalibacterium halodurans]MED4109063.1 hypothetical protein [Halalkalibacterium halodurans]MED4123700.1 hypothetical protein [Halalkalibacterium halodurans]